MHGQQAPRPAPSAAAGADDENSEVVVLPEFAVRTSAKDTSMRAEETLGAMRINTLLVESPITVTVLKPEFLEAFSLSQEHEQAAFIAGGNAITEWQTGAATPSLRGFGANFYRNGFQRWGYNTTVNIERVEFVKGPLAATFGRSSPGGIINYITKRAQRKPAYGFYHNTGTYYQNTEMSATGPVAKNLFYRTDFQYMKIGGPQDFFFHRTWAASASFTWQISKNTVWMFDFEQKVQTLNRGHAGLIMRWTGANQVMSPVTGAWNTGQVTGGRLISYSYFNARGPDEYNHRKISTFDTRFEHRFSRYLSLRINGQYYFGNYERWGWGTNEPTNIPVYNMITGILPGRRPYYENHDPRTFAGQADLLSEFKIGPTSHKLLLTMDVSDARDKLPDWTMSAENLAALPDTILNLRVANPDWGGFDRSLVTELFHDRRVRYEDIGFLLSERMELLRGRVLLYASLRHDDFRARYDDYMEPSKTGSLNKNMFNETYGGVVHIIPGKLIAFANRSTSFTASTTYDRGTGKLQDPVTSRGIEAGARGEILKDPGSRRALYWSASAYQIDRKIAQRNPYYSDDDSDYDGSMPEYLNNGIERVNGVEVEFFGDITRQFSMSLTYTKLDAFVKDYPEEPEREGVPLLYVPKTSLSSTLRYEVTEGPMRGFAVGFTMRHNSEYFARYGTFGSQVTGVDSITQNGGITGNLRVKNKNGDPYGPNNAIEEVRPAITLFDIFAEYVFCTGKYRHTVGVNIKNLTDAVWYNSSGQLNAGCQIQVRYRLRF
ncbi:TonB-dependent receptor [Termitidicoccus mucosus]|uniref:TonB-dependent siderophore receptor n=1 Tax=Termitidicoccus mucosus TaxID=1184151 RepID=UPI00083980A6